MKKLFFYWFIMAVVASSCKKEAAATPDNGPYFPQVKAIIQQNCVSCHQPGGQGLPTMLIADSSIVNLSAAIKAATIDPASPRNKRMPQGGELSEADKNIILKWYLKGGKATD